MPIDPTFLDQLKQMNFLARKKVSSLYMGGRKSVMMGRGIEIVDHREYYPGDDFRAIDWKLYGRTEKLYIRRFEEEKKQILHLLVDSSASMDFSVDGMRKFDYAGSLAAGFAFVAMRNYEKFTTTLYREGIGRLMQPKKGKRNFFRAIEMLNRADQSGETNLKRCIEQYSSMIKSKAFMIVISDFLEPMQSLRDGIYRIAKSSKDAKIVQVLDPGEITLKWRDDVEFEDMEGTETIKTFLSPGFRRDYRKRLEEHILQLHSICDDAGVDFHSVRSNEPLFNAFVRIMGAA